MANAKNIEPYKFKKGQSGNPNGRPKNRVVEYTRKMALKVDHLTAAEVATIEEIVFSATADQLVKITKDPKTPAYLLAKARAALTDIKNGKCDTLDKLRGLIFGESVQHIDITTNGETLNNQQMTAQQAKEFLKNLDETI